MTTNLLLLDAGFPLDGAAITSTATAATGYSLANLVGGNKTDAFRASASATTVRFTIGSSSGTARYLYLGGAKGLQGSGVTTLGIYGGASTNFALATLITTVPGFSAMTLYGPGQDDYVTLFSGSVFAYHFVNLVGTGGYFQLSKLSLGDYFDPGLDPNQPIVVTRVKPTGGMRRAVYTLQITWQGMTYAKAVEMYQRFYRPRRHTPMALMTRDYHAPLLGHRVLFGRVLDMTLPPRATDYCDVQLTFEEVP